MNKTSLAGLFAFGTLLIAPNLVSADTIQASTNQILPAGGNSCVALSTSDFKVYVYDGAVHSFEFTVPDISYVAVGGSLGGETIPFWLTSRRVDGAGNLRIHVDVSTTPVTGTLPASITLLSSKQGQPTCVSTVTMAITPRSGVVGETTTSFVPTPNVASGVLPSAQTPAKPEHQAMEGAEAPVTPTEEKAAVIPAAITSTKAFVTKMCSYNDGSQVWAMLLALYALIVAAALLSPIRSIWGVEAWVLRLALVAIPLGFLLAFWFLAEYCRAGYMPLVTSIIVGAAGAYGVYRTQPRIISEQKSLITL